MKYTNKKKIIAVMVLIITAASFGGCNSANTTATIDPEVTSSEIVSSAPVSSEATSSETASSASMNSEAEKPESEAAPSEATTSSAAEVSSKTEAPVVSSEPAVSSVPTAVSQPAVSSAPAAVSKPATTSQPVSSAATSAPPAKTVSAPAQQQSSSTKAVEDMTEEELDQWMLEQLEQLNNQPIEIHHLGTERIDSSPSTKNADDDAERKALEKEKLEQLRQNLQGSQNEQKTEQEVSQTEEQDLETNPTEEQETVSEATGDVYEAIRLINQERVKAGLNELEIDNTIMEMAAVRAKEITVVYDHVRPDGNYFTSVFDEFNYKHHGVVENIYASPDTASKAVAGWMNSPGHKANILKESLTKIGVGYYYDANSEYYHHWVMLGAN